MGLISKACSRSGAVSSYQVSFGLSRCNSTSSRRAASGSLCLRATQACPAKRHAASTSPVTARALRFAAQQRREHLAFLHGLGRGQDTHHRLGRIEVAVVEVPDGLGPVGIVRGCGRRRTLRRLVRPGRPEQHFPVAALMRTGNMPRHCASAMCWTP